MVRLMSRHLRNQTFEIVDHSVLQETLHASQERSFLLPRILDVEKESTSSQRQSTE
jgi:hypothetical protein